VAPAEPFFRIFFPPFFPTHFFPFGPMPNPGNGKFRYEREKSTFSASDKYPIFFTSQARLILPRTRDRKKSFFFGGARGKFL
jgi:hypothetical protein